MLAVQLMMLDKESLVRAVRELPTFDYQRETPSFEVSELACFYCMQALEMQIFAIYFKDTFSFKNKGSGFGVAVNSIVLRKHLSSVFRKKNVKKFFFF